MWRQECASVLLSLSQIASSSEQVERNCTGASERLSETVWRRASGQRYRTFVALIAVTLRRGAADCCHAPATENTLESDLTRSLWCTYTEPVNSPSKQYAARPMRLVITVA